MNRELITYNDPKSPVSEMFKTLRTNIQFMNSDKQLKTLLVSSTLPGEGKSWTAANLAVTFAQAGKKVLIIDGDMRKGRQFNIFGVSPTPGLSNYLSGVSEANIDNSNIENYIQKTEINNLFVMTAGNVPPNPSELLVSEKMLELNKTVKQMFDITIFDGTPSLIVTDAPILARIVDSTIIVTAHNETKIDNVAKVKKAIESIGGKVAGVVVNKMPVSTKKYENTYYYGSTMPTVTKGKRKKHNKNHDSSWNETTAAPWTETESEFKTSSWGNDETVTQTSTWNNSDTIDETTLESEPETIETATSWNNADSTTTDNSIENVIKENWNQIEEKTWKTSENNSSTTENWDEDNESNTTDFQESTTNSLQDTLETVKSWNESNSITTSDSWSKNNSTTTNENWSESNSATTVDSWSENNNSSTSDSWSENNSIITSDSWSESNSEATESWTENNSTEWEENEKIIDTTNLNNPSSKEWENDSWNEKVDESPLDWSNTDQESEPVAAEPILSWEQDETKNSNDTIFKSFENTESFNDNLNSYSFNDSNNNTSVDNSFGSETQNTNYNSSDVLESTQDVINQINKYLEEEKNKLKNGDFNG